MLITTTDEGVEKLPEAANSLFFGFGEMTTVCEKATESKEKAFSHFPCAFPFCFSLFFMYFLAKSHF